MLTAGGPYCVDDTLSVAFATPTVGRLLAHGTSMAQTSYAVAIVPETISVLVTHAATPYPRDTVLTLSFVDPRIARIHATSERARETYGFDDVPDVVVADVASPVATRWLEPERIEGTVADPPARAHERTTIAGIGASICTVIRANVQPPPETASGDAGGVHVRLHWTPDRVRRFVQVVDKLFTVDRLGWYRHVFTMRLLVPDEISCGDAVSDMETKRHLVALRAAAVETLGRPMLAAFMPNFTVTSDWLDSLDSPPGARALAGLRDAIVPHLTDDIVPSLPDDAFITTGIVDRREFVRQPASSVEAILPILIAPRAMDPTLSQRLSEYRQILIDVFGQTAQSAEAVRVNQMTQPNRALDDRLWQLVGSVGETLGGLAVASKK